MAPSFKKHLLFVFFCPRGGISKKFIFLSEENVKSTTVKYILISLVKPFLMSYFTRELKLRKLKGSKTDFVRTWQKNPKEDLIAGSQSNGRRRTHGKRK